MQIQQANTGAEIEACYIVMKQLRQDQPWMAEVQLFVSKVQRMQQHEGFRLVCLLDGGAVRAVAGYRIAESLWLGKEMFIAGESQQAAAEPSVCILNKHLQLIRHLLSRLC